MIIRMIKRTCRPTLLVLLAVVAGCGGGSGEGGSQRTTFSLPLAPTNVSAVGEDDSVRITWAVSENASRYNVYWSAVPGVNAQIGNPVVSSNLQAVVTDLRDDTIYYLVVTAVNSLGESAESAEVQAQPVLSIPAEVAGISAEPGDGQITLQWFPQANSDSYSVEVGNRSVGGPIISLTATTSPLVVNGLTNGMTYYLTVAGINDAGTGSQSGKLDAMPVAPVAGWTPQTRINVPSCQAPTAITCKWPIFARVKDLAINERGVAAVLWDHREGLGRPLRLAVNHTASGTWGEQFFLDVDSGFASVAITPDGDIHVVYNIVEDLFFEDIGIGYGSVLQKVFWRRYRAGSWSDPVEIESPNQSLSHLFVDLAADDQGNVFATWVERDWEPGASAQSAISQIWVRRFDAVADSWDDAVMIGESVDEIDYPSVAIGPSNTAFVVWMQDTVPYDPDPNILGKRPERRVIFASRFDGVAWQPGTIVGRNDLVDWDDVTQFALDVNSTGSAIITWIQELSSTNGSPDSYQVGAARSDALLGQWSAPELILEGSRRPFNPDVAIGATNESIAAWHTGVSAGVGSSTYDTAANSWGPVVSLPTDTMYAGNEFGIEDDGTGAFVLAWSSSRDPRGLFVRRLEPGSTGWSSSDVLGGHVTIPRIKTADSGHTIIVTQDTASRVYVTIYSP